jgi:hypothetical protein
MKNTYDAKLETLTQQMAELRKTGNQKADTYKLVD